MRKVLLVIRDLGYDSPSAQLSLLLRTLPDEEFSCRVCVLGRAGTPAERLREAGVLVDAPGRGRLLDLRPMAHLRELVRSFAPDVVHVWGLSPLRALAVSGFQGRVVASPCLKPDSARSWLRRLDGWLLRKADRVVAFGNVEAERCRALGIDPARLVVVQPAVRLEESPANRLRKLPGVVPEGMRFILCVGRLLMHKGFVEAVWAHDILRYVHPELHLVVAGVGPDRARLERFSAGLQSAASVHLAGEIADVSELMKRAELVWSPGRVETGRQVVLEAMAAGKAVVASNFPGLAELVREGQTGLLVPAEDKAALARETQQLLTDPPLRARFGEAARQRAEEEHRPEVLAKQCAMLYKGG